MTTLYVLVGLSCFFSFINVVFVLFLSNSLFRLFITKEEPDQRSMPKGTPEPKANLTQDSGLVDVGYYPTYDARFRK